MATYTQSSVAKSMLLGCFAFSTGRVGRVDSVNLDKINLWGSSLKDIPSQTLQAELARLGYNLSSLLRDLDETQTRTGEIVTIG